MNTPIMLVKQTGQPEPFSRDKFRNSLIRSRIPKDRIDEVVYAIEPQLYNGMTTHELYRRTFDYLHNHVQESAGRYKLKQALMQLGPTGFPFERYISALFKSLGFEIVVDIIVTGKCVKHEVDVIAMKDDTHHFLECKFHHNQAGRTRVKDALYVRARFDDMHAAFVLQIAHAQKIDHHWLVTNTKFSGDAIQFAECAGLKLLSWDYPNNQSLSNLIDNHGLYPLTCLTTMPHLIKIAFMKQDIILCRDVLANIHIAREHGLNQKKVDAILHECKTLCTS